MLRLPSALLSLTFLLTLASSTLALTLHYTHEEVGPAKGAVGPPYANPESAFRHSPLRCYWRESSFDGFGSSRRDFRAAFRGDVDDVNAALATFATLPAKDKVVRLFPGPGSVRSANGKETFSCDWELHWARQIYTPRDGKTGPSETHTAVLTLYVRRAEPIPKADPRVDRWILELDDDSLQVREGASLALEHLGEAARPALRAALGKNPAPEQRRRIGRLLDHLKPIHLHRVKLPSGVRVVSLDELVRQAEKDWRSGDLGRSWQAVTDVAEWVEYSEATFPLLVEALRDPRAQVRDLAEKAFARLGQRGKEDQDRWRENRCLRAAIAEYRRTH